MTKETSLNKITLELTDKELDLLYKAVNRGDNFVQFDGWSHSKESEVLRDKVSGIVAAHKQKKELADVE